MEKINNIFEKNITKIFLIFLFIQPIIDIISAISINYFNLSLTISSIIRLCFLGLCVYYLIFINKKHNKLLLITAIYLLLFFLMNVIYKDFSAAIYEIHNALNTFYFPILLIALINIMKEYNIKINLNHVICLYFIYIIFIVVPNILNIGFISYSHSKLGQVGFFLSANAIGNILSILLPLVFYYIVQSKKNILLKIIMIISILYVFFTIGTKVPFMSLLVVIAINFIYYIICWIKLKKYKNIITCIVLFIISIILSTAILPKTNFYKNIEIHKNFLHINNFSEVITNYDLIDHFIFSQRLTFFNSTKNNYLKANIFEKLFGIGYIENYATDSVSTKTVEIDYFDIFFRQGIIGTVIYIILLINTIILLIKVLNKRNLLHIQYKISILLILLLSLFSGHILVTPAVSIYVSLINSLIINKNLELST